MLSLEKLHLLRNDPAFQELVKKIREEQEYALVRFKEAQNYEELLRAQVQYKTVEWVLYMLERWLPIQENE